MRKIMIKLYRRLQNISDRRKIAFTNIYVQASNSTRERRHWQTHLRQLSKHCEFTDEEFEIKMHIVCNGTSSRLRKKALKESDYSLRDMLIDGRKFETSNAQASGMEEKIKDVQLNQVEEKPTTPKCYNCGFAYPHPDLLVQPKFNMYFMWNTWWICASISPVA